MIKIPLLLSLAIAVSAAELVVRDLRVDLGTRPTAFSFTVHSPTKDISGSDSFDAGLVLEVGGRWSLSRPGHSLGLVLGADVEREQYAYLTGGNLGVTAVRGSVGLGWAATDRVTITPEVGAMWGLSQLSMPAQYTVPSSNTSGSVVGYDLRLDASWMLSRRFGVGAYAGWDIADHSLKGDGLTISLSQSGWIAGASLVWRFTDAPATLQ